MSLKKIDLTQKVNKITLNTNANNAISALAGKFPQLQQLQQKVNSTTISNTNPLSNPLLARMGNINTLQNYVVKALNDYTGCTIAESSGVIRLANTLKETPVCEINNEEFEIIERSLAESPAHVKAAWNDMVISLNTENTEE